MYKNILPIICLGKAATFLIAESFCFSIFHGMPFFYGKQMLFTISLKTMSRNFAYAFFVF